MGKIKMRANCTRDITSLGEDHMLPTAAMSELSDQIRTEEIRGLQDRNIDWFRGHGMAYEVPDSPSRYHGRIQPANLIPSTDPALQSNLNAMAVLIACYPCPKSSLSCIVSIVASIT